MVTKRSPPRGKLTAREINTKADLAKEIHDAAAAYALDLAIAGRAAKDRDLAASMYADAVARYDPHDPLVAESHRVMLSLAERARFVEGRLPGANFGDTAETIRVFYALMHGEPNETAAVVLARMAAAYDGSDSDIRKRAKASEILGAPPQAADGGARDRAQKARVVDRWVAAMIVQISAMEYVVAHGIERPDGSFDELSSEERSRGLEKLAEARALLAPHV